ncbi:MAG: galactose mutarotase [Clostridia bacterium]|nr:galactose mutarotase [Clostridia bacterium]
MIKKELFDVYQGKEIYRYTLTDGISVSIITLGTRVLDLIVPDRNGKKVDVALNMKNSEDAISKGGYMGSTVGRCGNRIGGDGFDLNGKHYTIYHTKTAAHVHGGKKGFDTHIFDAQVNEAENSVTMSSFSPDGEEGYPANLTFSVKFTVTGTTLKIEYFAEADGDTIVNLTNHTYFNLNGESDGSILDNELYINAYGYLPTDKLQIPTGEIRPVDGTPFDFRVSKPIGRDIGADDEDLLIGGGYDHNFCLSGSHFATVYSPKTGIVMDCYTDRPGVQFYDGNLLRDVDGKSIYPKHAGFCLESQLFPDAIHKPDWQSPILRKGEKLYSKTEYSFSVRK